MSSSAAQKRTLPPCGSSRGPFVTHSARGSAPITFLGPSVFRFSLFSCRFLPVPDGYNRVGLRNTLSGYRRPLGAESPERARPDQHIAQPLHLTWPLSSSLPLSPVFFNPSFPLTLPSSPFIVILPLLSHRIGQRRPFREGHQSRLSICNGDSLCPSRGGSRQSTLYLSPSILAHRRFLRLLRCLSSLRPTPHRAYTANSAPKEQKRKSERMSEGAGRGMVDFTELDTSPL